MSRPPESPLPDARPPVVEGRPPLGSWPRIYAAVLLVAVVTIGLLWWFTATYNVDAR